MRNFFFILKSLCGGKSANTPPSEFRPASQVLNLAFLKPLALVLLLLTMGVGNVWGAVKTVKWVRVTSIPDLTSGGTFIMGYEATAKSGTIVPLRSKDCGATTTANGFFNSGTTTTSGNGTITMSTVTATSDYEIYISSPVNGKINIQRETSSGNYYGATSGGTSKNTGRLYTSGNSNETNLTPELVNESNNQFKLTAGVTGQYKYLKYNTGAPRFAFYNSADNIVFYKKATLSSISVKTAPSKTTYSEGENFAPAGLVITKTWSDNSTEEITYNNTTKSDFSFSPTLAVSLASSNTSVRITYGGKYVDLPITVNAVACGNKITITKGTPSNGSFDIAGDGDVCIDDGNASVTISNIEPASGFRFKEITSTVGNIDNSAKTVTDIDADATINVLFEEIPSHKVYFYNGSSLLNEGGTSVSEGSDVEYTGSVPTSCDTGEGASTTFAGWATDKWDGKVAKNAIAPDFYESTLPVMGDADVTYYAVFCKGGGLTLATSIAANDIVYLATAADGYGVTGANENGKDATINDNISDWMPFTVENGSGSGKWKLKNGNSYILATLKNFAMGANPNDMTFEQDGTSGKYRMIFNIASGSNAGDYALGKNSSGDYYRFYKITNTYDWYYVYKANPSTNYMTSCCEALGQISGSVNVSNDGCGAGELKATWKMKATTGIASQVLHVYKASDDSEVTAKKITGITASTEDQTKIISGLEPCTAYYVKVENISNGGSFCGDGWAGEKSASATTKGYTYSFTLTDSHVTKTAGTEKATTCDGNIEYTFEAVSGWVLPKDITVTNADEGWLWDDSEGTLLIDASKVTGNVEVTIEATAAPCEPMVAPSVTATPTYNGATLNWGAVEHASKYKVYIYTNEDVEVVKDENVTSTTYTVSSPLTKQTTYKYRVDAVSEDEASYCSSFKAGTFNTADYPTVQLYYSENGELSAGVGQQILTDFTLPNEAAECSKTFIGWTTLSSYSHASEAPDPFYEKGATFQIPTNANCTLYAVYADVVEGSLSYDLITSVATNDIVVFSTNPAYTAQTMKTAGALSSDVLGTTTSTYNNDKSKITSLATGTVEYTIGGNSNDGWTLKNGTKYLAMKTNAKNKLQLQDDTYTWAISFDGNIAKILRAGHSYTDNNQQKSGDFTIQYNYNQGSDRFSGYTSEQVGISLYKKNVTEASTTNYSTTCMGKVAKPVITGVTGSTTYEANQTVTITSATEGATIKYTIDGSNPASSETTMASGSSFTLSENGTYTIRAIAVKADMTNSDEADAVSNVTIDKPYTTIASFIAAAPSTAKKLAVTDAVVLGATDKYIYIQDATGGIQLYKNSHGLTFASGKTLSGFVAGTYSNNSTSAYMPRLTFSDGSTMSVTEDAPALPDPVVITAGSEANICKLVKLRNVKFQSTALSSNTVYVEKEGGDIDTVYNTFNVLDKSLPNSATLCDVTGVLIKHSQKYEIAPVSVDGITTNGALAILPTLSVTGSTDSDNPTAVAEGKVITITPADGMTSTLKDGDAAVADLTSATNVTIDADKAITVTASAYYYTENSATYYYYVDPSLTEHAISKASISNGSVTIQNGGDEVSSAVADATITLLVTPSTHYHMSTISVTDEDEGNVDVTEVIAGEQYTFKMPAKAVTVNATFAEDAYAMVTFAKGDESATGTAPSSFKKYVGQEAIMPANTFTLSGNSFTGWKYGDDTYDVSAGYTILAQDAEIGGKTITFEAQWEPYPWAGNGKWELVTDASELVTSPKMYIIFAKNNKAGGAQSNNYRVLEDVTIADGLLTWTGVDPAVFTLESGNVENTFAFADAANGGYLNANGTENNNYLTTTASKASNNASWGIESINAETGEAVIKAKSSNRNMLSINTQNSRFSAYGQAQAGLQVFKFVAGSYFNINYAKGVEAEEEDNVSNMPTTQVTASDGTATLSDKVPVYVGYVFEGWKLDENTTYQPNDIVGPLSQNITLTAQWTAAEKHMLSYDKNGGEGDVDVDTEYYPNDVVTLAGALTKDGLIFAGWEYDGNVYAAGAQFTMPDQNVVMTAKFAQGAIYTFPGTAQGTTVVAGAPEGSTFEFTNGGNYNSGQVQLTGNSGNTMTLTLSGYDLYTIKAITLNMRSNSGAGAGTFSATINGNTVAELANADFDEWFDNTTFGATNRDVHVAITPVRVQSGQDIVITLTGTTNSIYIKSVTIEYELILDVIRDNLSEGKWGTICPDHRINYPTGASFYTLTYLQMEAGMPYKLFFDEVETDYLEAGKPYLFIAEGKAIKGIKVGNEVATAANYNGFYGNVSGSTNTIYTIQTEYQASGDIVNYYGLKNNTFTLLGNGTTVANERAVVQIKNGQLDCPNPPSHLAPARPGVRRVVASNNAPQIATGVDELNASETPVKMMIDGQLFILRGEKMYDATGHLVK